MPSRILPVTTLEEFFDEPLRELVPQEVPRHYLCSLLVSTTTKPFRTIEKDGDAYAERVLKMLASTDAITAAREMREMGDTLLIGCGLYPEEIIHTAERTGKPGVEYFKGIGSNAYLVTAKISRKRRVLFGMHNPDLFTHLSVKFDRFVDVLRYLKENVFVEAEPLRHLFVPVKDRSYDADVSDYSVSVDDKLIIGIDINTKN